MVYGIWYKCKTILMAVRRAVLKIHVEKFSRHLGARVVAPSYDEVREVVRGCIGPPASLFNYYLKLHQMYLYEIRPDRQTKVKVKALQWSLVSILKSLNLTTFWSESYLESAIRAPKTCNIGVWIKSEPTCFGRNDTSGLRTYDEYEVTTFEAPARVLGGWELVIPFAFKLPAQLARVMTLIDLLGKPWSELSTLLPPAACLWCAVFRAYIWCMCKVLHHSPVVQRSHSRRHSIPGTRYWS